MRVSHGMFEISNPGVDQRMKSLRAQVPESSQKGWSGAGHSPPFNSGSRTRPVCKQRLCPQFMCAVPAVHVAISPVDCWF